MGNNRAYYDASMKLDLDVYPNMLKKTGREPELGSTIKTTI